MVLPSSRDVGASSHCRRACWADGMGLAAPSIAQVAFSFPVQWPARVVRHASNSSRPGDTHRIALPSTHQSRNFCVSGSWATRVNTTQDRAMRVGKVAAGGCPSPTRQHHHSSFHPSIHRLSLPFFLHASPSQHAPRLAIWRGCVGWRGGLREYQACVLHRDPPF